MAKSQCMYCGSTEGCISGCDGPCCGGGKKKDEPAKKPPKHAHQWVWKRRANPIIGRPFDEYKCSVAGCDAIDQRPV